MALGAGTGDPSPPTLQELMIEYTLNDLRTVCVVDTNGKVVSLREDAYLPSVISDRIINSLARRGTLDDSKLQALCDRNRVQLKKINLSRTALSDESLEKLSSHKLIELDISECENLSKDCLPSLLKFTSLQLLNLHRCRDALEKYGLPLFDFPLKNLRILNIGYTDLSGVQLHCLVQELRNLTVLDVSKVVKNGNLSFLDPVRHQLRSLVLHDCVLVKSSLEYVCTLPQLRHLDISVNNEGYKLPLTTAMLKCLVKSLSSLLSLDLSGNDITNHTRNENNDGDARMVDNGNQVELQDLAQGIIVDDEDDSSSSSSLEDRAEELDSEYEEEEDDANGGASGAAGRDVADSRPDQAEKPMDVDDHDGDVNVGISRMEGRKTNEEEEEEDIISSIDGLKGLRHKLHFLGLVGMDECEAEHIPAIKVAGVANEDQILVTIEMYLERRGFLLKGLNAYFDILRVINCQSPLRAVQGIINAMKRYPSDSQIQISGSASLFHLTRGNYKKHLTKTWRQAVISCLLDAIEVVDSVTLLRNCGLTLFNFSIPEDFQFQFERVVKNLVKLALTEDREGLLQRVYVHMCNSIVCHVEGRQKLLVGKLGIITCMLKLIKDRLDRKICDEVMETAWSTLWNVTDETAHNCELFLHGDGMQLFLRCKETFRSRPELLRNMMGLMGNVAEVKALRPQLIPHVPVFASLLQDRTDGIEVSYNAAGALAHMASDGEDVWKASTRRDEVLNKMADAIESWQLDEQRNINYRSFEPILRLLNTYHTPQVQLWATWALANLCTVSREKYSRLLVSEGGLKKLEDLVARPDTWSRVTYFAQIAIRLSQQYRD
ncbi:protein zer-1 homolog [Lytechinus variegatus]|uniref:protein zer-1 homolog n=1 Tax=Lytechinus variegatus TaxID=7654 RepID=UPI001BB1BBC3|nr:protein zer-1 homolog [Lytechinus variegatus]